MTTPAELIRECLELANVIDPDEELQAGFAATGLSKLNDILMQWSSMGTYIEAYFIETVSILSGDFSYDITPPVIEMLQGNLLDGQNCMSVLYEADLKRQNTFNYALGVNAPSRPQYVFFQTSETEIQTKSILKIYPVPDQNYTATLYLKKRLTQLDQSDTITQFSSAYMKPLKYQLAKDLSEHYETILSDKFMLEYDKLMDQMKASNQQDMTVINTNPFNYYGRRFRPWGGRYVG